MGALVHANIYFSIMHKFRQEYFDIIFCKEILPSYLTNMRIAVTLIYRVFLNGELVMEDNKKLDDAIEDIKTIRDVLSRAMASYKKLSPIFLHIAIILGAYAILNILLSIFDYYEITHIIESNSHVHIAYVSLALDIALCFALLFIYNKLVKTAKTTSYSPVVNKLIYVWAISIIIFTVMLFLMCVVHPVIIHFFDNTDNFVFAQGAEHANLYILCILPVIFPVMPLILTSVFLENKRLTILGIIIFILSIIWMLLMMIAVNTSSATATTFVFRIILSLLVQLTPCLSLLVLNAQLKRI